MPKQNGVSVQQKVGLRIKELRAKTDFSQEKLALQAGLDRTYINSVENGRRNISINSLSKISYALGTTLQDFFKSELFNKKG
jgi:transcriptional regulator with XRE-family HTH domain